MDFFDGIHTNHVPLFDEDGDDLDTAEDYAAIRDEFLGRPEQFALTDISAFLEMLDDSCEQPSYMDTITKIIHNIARHYQSEGVEYLVSHLQEVPQRGYELGFIVNLRLLIQDDATYPFLKDAVGRINSDTAKRLRQILSGDVGTDANGEESGIFPCFDPCGDETAATRKQELESLLSL